MNSIKYVILVITILCLSFYYLSRILNTRWILLQQKYAHFITQVDSTFLFFPAYFGEVNGLPEESYCYSIPCPYVPWDFDLFKLHHKWLAMYSHLVVHKYWKMLMSQSSNTFPRYYLNSSGARGFHLWDQKLRYKF